MADALASIPVLRVDWSLAEADRGIAAWTAFVAAEGVDLSIPDDVAKLVEQMEAKQERGMSPRMARDIVLQRLAFVTNRRLEEVGRDERMRRLLQGGGEVEDGCPRWAFLDEKTLDAIESSTDVRFAVTPGKALLLNLATLPLALLLLWLGYRAYTMERWDYVAATAVLYAVWYVARRAIQARLGGNR